MSSASEGFNLNGKCFIVTGASEGIGLAIAQSLNRDGAHVLMVSRSVEKLEKAKATLAFPDFSTVLSADLGKAEGRHALKKMTTSYERIDGIVNNLGGADRGSFDSFEESRILNQLNLNLVSSMEITKDLFEHLKKSRGAVVNITSVAAQTALPGRIWYGAAKSALEFSTKALAVEWGKHGIRVNGVAPWFIHTELTQAVLENPTFKNQLLAITPLGRLGKPEDIANCARFLLSPHSSYITGQIIAVDGGVTAQSGLG